MMPTTFFQDYIAELDLLLPWLLPALETFEKTFPPTVRLVTCVALIAGFVVLRQRNATSIAGRLQQIVL